MVMNSLFAVKITLKDGGVVSGEIVNETDTKLVISSNYGNIEIDKADIARREDDSPDSVSFSGSEYSFKKRSWTKYAFFTTLVTGIVTTTMLADSSNSSVPLFTGIGSGITALTFAGLDYYKYGRVNSSENILSMGPHLRHEPSISFTDAGRVPVEYHLAFHYHF